LGSSPTNRRRRRRREEEEALNLGVTFSATFVSYERFQGITL
jgi:hypothetical protein